MCGINGIFAYHHAADTIDRCELLATRDHMSSRGPDSAGLWISEDERLGLGHRRLSIIDLSEAGAQPMLSEDGRTVVTFNGEIYNYEEIRRKLEARGRSFRSRSDTEVLLQLYAENGEDMVHDLRGMFAFAIWDSRKRSLFLARDPYGIKPLYYSDSRGKFCFASQVKALLAGGAISREPDPAGQVGFLLWGSVPDPFTTYRGIRALPAGCSLVVDQAGGREPQRYHAIAQVYCDAEAYALETNRGGPAAAARQMEATREALRDAVRHHLVADVPVGAFLSSGIDSGALVGLMRDVSQSEIRTVTIAFEEFRGKAEDEAPLAAEVARVYGTDHYTRVVTEQEFKTELPKIFEAMDQPSIDGVNTWFVSKAAHELGLKVAVSGLGGDELFGGYPSFSQIPRWVKRLGVPARVPMLGLLARHILTATGLDRQLSSPKAAGLLELGGTFAGAYMLRRGLYMPWELDALLGRDIAREGLESLRPLDRVHDAMSPSPITAFNKIATMESSLYMRNQLLRDTDWASMAYGLEVRVPLVDATLLERVSRIGRPPAGAVPKAALALSPKTPLPDAVVRRSKTGFVVPTRSWGRPSRAGARPATDGARSSLGMDSRAWSRRVLAELAV